LAGLNEVHEEIRAVRARVDETNAGMIENRTILRRVEVKQDQTNGRLGVVEQNNLRIEGALSVIRWIMAATFGVIAAVGTITSIVVAIGKIGG